MTVNATVAGEIRRLHFSEKFSVHTVASQVGVHPDVVRRLVGHVTNSAGTKVQVAELLDAYAPFIQDTLAQYPRLRSTRIFDMLVARGFLGSPRTVRRYVASVRPRPRGEICLRPQPLIGEQAQVDWMHVGTLPVGTGERTVWAFVMVLSHSRALWAELLFDLSAHAVRRSLLRACAYFGGCTRQWLFDNPKTVVLDRHGDNYRFHPLILELCGALHVQPRLCAVRHPQSKGRVERAVRYLRERFLAGRMLVNLEQGNAELRDFVDRVAPSRPHPEFGPLTVGEVLAAERPRLLPLPATLPPQEATMPGTVDRYGLVSFDQNRYSVPSDQGRGPCVIAFDDVTVRLLVDGCEVARHRRCWGRRQVLERAEHRAEHAKKRPLGRTSVAQQRLRQAVPDIDKLFARWLSAGRNMGSVTAYTVKLLDLYGEAIFAEAMAHVLRSDRHDPGAVALMCDQIRARRGKPAPVTVPFGKHVVDAEVLQHSLESYDA